MKPATRGLLQELEIVLGGLFRCPFLDLGWASHGEGRICFFVVFFERKPFCFERKVKEQSDSLWGGDEIMMVMEMMIMIMIHDHDNDIR